MLIRCYVIFPLTIMGFVCQFIVLCVSLLHSPRCVADPIVRLRHFFDLLLHLTSVFSAVSPLFTFSINLIVTNMITHANLHSLTEVLQFSLELFCYL